MVFLAAIVMIMLLVWGMAMGQTPLVKPPVKAADPAPTPVAAPAPVPLSGTEHFLLVLAGALIAAVPVWIQTWRNGSATAANKVAIEESRAAQGRLHMALAEKLGLPPVPKEAPAVPVAPPDKLDQIIALLSKEKT
jgi:hypothetical protein